MRVLGPIKSGESENGDPPERRRKVSKLRRKTTVQPEQSVSIGAVEIFKSGDEPPNPKVHFKEQNGDGKQAAGNIEQIPGSDRVY